MDFIKTFSSRIGILIILSCLCLPVLSAPTLEDYGALPSVSMMAVSPSGNRVAFRRHDGKTDRLVVMSLAGQVVVGGANIGKLTPRRLYFLNESQVVVVAGEHRRVLGYRDSFDVSTAFLYDVDTGKLVQLLTPGDRILTGQTGLGHVVGVTTTAEGKSYAYMPAYVGRSDTDPSPAYSLIKVDLDSPRRPGVAYRGRNATTAYFVDSEGNVLAEERFNNQFGYHSVLSFIGGVEKEIFRQDTEVPQLGLVGLTPDLKALVVADEIGDRTRYRTLSLINGEFSGPIYGRNDADVTMPLRGINQVVHGVLYSGFRPSYQFLDPELNQRMGAILAAYPDHAVWLESWSPDWQHLIVRVEGNNAPGAFILYSKNEEDRFLGTARPNIKARDINPVVEFDYRARDGLRIPALMTVPANRIENVKKLPAVMLPHGGPAAHDWFGFDWLAQALASRGYLVIQPQFRGSAGFGAAHWRAGRGEWGKKMQDDITDGLAHLVGQGLVDPDRVCIAGISYGGYAALAGGAYTPELYRCVVSINGVADLPVMLSAERSRYGRNHWVLAYWGDSMAQGETGRAALRAISPAYAAEKFQAPVLLLHGSNDTVVDFRQASIMQNQLRRAKKPVELVKLKGEDHHLSNPATRLRALKSMVVFIDEHIGKAPKATP